LGKCGKTDRGNAGMPIDHADVTPRSSAVVGVRFVGKVLFEESNDGWPVYIIPTALVCGHVQALVEELDEARVVPGSLRRRVDSCERYARTEDRMPELQVPAAELIVQTTFLDVLQFPLDKELDRARPELGLYPFRQPLQPTIGHGRTIQP